jgi:DNA-binding response OmpR family regulator
MVLIVADIAQHCSAVLRSLQDLPALRMHGPVGALEALRICTLSAPAAAVIHMTLSDISGPELCCLLRGRRRTTNVPLLLFESRDKYAPAPTLLRHADRYVPPQELADIARYVQGLHEPSADPARTQPLLKEYAGRHLRTDFERILVSVDGERVDLTRRELKLLQFLLTHINRVLTRDDLLAHVWNGANDGRSRTIDTHIRRLRMKLGKAGHQIQTLTRVGYRFNEE